MLLFKSYIKNKYQYEYNKNKIKCEKNYNIFINYLNFKGYYLK